MIEREKRNKCTQTFILTNKLIVSYVLIQLKLIHANRLNYSKRNFFEYKNKEVFYLKLLILFSMYISSSIYFQQQIFEIYLFFFPWTFLINTIEILENIRVLISISYQKLFLCT